MQNLYLNLSHHLQAHCPEVGKRKTSQIIIKQIKIK